MLVDQRNRPVRSLRLSVTDRCNIRCQYCMPEEEYTWLPRRSILSFEELERVVGAFAAIGVERIRLTGGEPLLRHDLPALIGKIRDVPGVEEIAMTTNGVVLDRVAGELREAGLDRITVSLDTLRRDRYTTFTRKDRIDSVFRGVSAIRDAGFSGTKINTVVMKGFNDDELADLIEFGKDNQVRVRFIEYMDVGGATGWTVDHVVPRTQILENLSARYGAIEEVEPAWSSAPARTYALADGTTFGIIASTTTPFCDTCDRARLTADGHLFLCLYADEGVDLKAILRGGATDDEVRGELTKIWEARNDRGAFDRLAQIQRDALYPAESLRERPHREMHTRGG